MRKAILLLVTLALLLSSWTPVGEQLSPQQQAIFATVGLSSTDTTLSRSFCSGMTIMATKPYVLSAGHCAADKDTTITTAAYRFGKDQIVTNTVDSAQIKLVHEFMSSGQDISVWSAVSLKDEATLRKHAFPAPKVVTLNELEKVICLTIRHLWDLDGVEVFYLVPLEGRVGQVTADTQPNSLRKDIYTFNQTAYPGMSGSFCYDANWQPTSLIIATVFNESSLPEIPAFLEGPEAVNMALDFIWSGKESPASPKAVINIPSEAKWANWNQLGISAQSLWATAYAQNEVYALKSYLGGYLFKMQTISVLIKGDEAFKAAYKSAEFHLVGHLQDWKEWLSSWTVVKIESSTTP